VTFVTGFMMSQGVRFRTAGRGFGKTRLGGRGLGGHILCNKIGRGSLLGLRSLKKNILAFYTTILFEYTM
jgi:hypothetical protein